MRLEHREEVVGATDRKPIDVVTGPKSGVSAHILMR
jgi:hypothetical protein